MSDLNKTALTHEVTRDTIAWLRERGFKPVETEVQITDGWVADIAGVIVPSRSELAPLRLLPNKPAYSSGGNYKQSAWEKDAGALLRPYTCLVEVKTSRADFLRDHKWSSQRLTDLSYLAVPKGLIDQKEWPEGWGILEFDTEFYAKLDKARQSLKDELTRVFGEEADAAFHDHRRVSTPELKNLYYAHLDAEDKRKRAPKRGLTMKCVRHAPVATISHECRLAVVVNISIRQFNNANFDQKRERTKRERDREKAQRFVDVIEGVCSLVESTHEHFELALLFSRLRINEDKFPELLLRLRRIWGLGKHLEPDERLMTRTSRSKGLAWLLKRSANGNQSHI